jgi:16S rRNA (guanine(1405)-N(7))-methyltransferase
MNAEELERLVEAVQANPKYRPISAGLVRRLGALELAKGRGWKEAVKATRNKLHQVGGAYQEGGIHYPAWRKELEQLPADLHAPETKDFCRRMLAQHASTRERLPVLDVFFQETLGGLAPISSILDVACGLNPLAAPWMPLAANVVYNACDIYQDLVDFLNLFFEHFGLKGQARVCDLTEEIPQTQAEVTLMLKTLPCLEQIDKTVSLRLLEGIGSQRVLVSFPAQSLGGRSKGMPEFYEAHLREMLAGRTWQMQRFAFQTELAFLIDKSPAEGSV